MINSNFSKKILIAIFQLSSLATYALTPEEGLIERVQPYLDTHAIFGSAHAVLIDSSWVLASPDTTIVSDLKRKINGIEYGIRKTIPLPSIDDVQYNLYYLDKPVVNVKPIARVRFLPSSELDGIIVGQYENNNVADSKKFKENKLEDSNGIEQGDVGDPIFWHSSDNENYGLIGFLNSISTIKPLTKELNTQIDNEMIKQALTGIELINSEEKKLEEETKIIEEEHPKTPPHSSNTSKSENEEIKHEEEKSTEKKELTLPKAAGYNATLIDSSWLLTFKSEGENPVGSKVRYSEKKEDEVTVDKVIDNSDGPFRLLHLDQPILDQPMKRARLAKDETPDELFSVSKIFKNTTAGNIFYLRVDISENEVVLIKKHSLNPTIQQFNIQEISNQHFSTGSGVFLQNPSGEFELYAVAEKKSQLFPLTIEVNTWIDNEIMKQALTPTELPEKIEEEIHPKILIETTSSEETKKQIKDKKEIENVLSEIQKTFNEDIYITGYPKLNEEWKKLVNKKKTELDHVTTNQELVNILNGLITELKKDQEIKNYPLSVTLTPKVTSPISQPESPVTLSFAVTEPGTFSNYYAAVIKISDLNNTDLTTQLSISINNLNKNWNNPKYINKKLKNGEIKNIIIDLRDTQGNNPGILKSVLGDLIGSGKLFSIAQSKEGIENLKTTGTTSIQIGLAKPLVVLVNQNTSGTAEIMAQALADIGGAVIIGTRTADKVDATKTTKISGLDNELIWFTYPVVDFLRPSNGESLQQVGGVRFLKTKDISLTMNRKANQYALEVAIAYIKNPKATLEKYKLVQQK